MLELMFRNSLLSNNLLRRGILLAVAVLLAFSARLAADETGCEEYAPPECSTMWSVTYPTGGALLNTQQFQAQGSKPHSAGNVRADLQKHLGVDEQGQPIWGTIQTETVTGNTGWSATFVPPMGGWSTGTYRIQLRNGAGAEKAHGTSFSIFSMPMP